MVILFLAFLELYLREWVYKNQVNGVIIIVITAILTDMTEIFLIVLLRNFL